MWNKFSPFIHFSPASLSPSVIVTFYSQLILWLGTVSILSHYSYSQINEKKLGFMLTGFDSESCLKSSIKTIALWDCRVLVPAIIRFFHGFSFHRKFVVLSIPSLVLLLIILLCISIVSLVTFFLFLRIMLDTHPMLPFEHSIQHLQLFLSR